MVRESAGIMCMVGCWVWGGEGISFFFAFGVDLGGEGS